MLAHVRVIDGTGAPPLDDRNVVLERGKITAIQPGADVPAAQGSTVLDLSGFTVMPGIVGMHDHLFYIARPNMDSQRSFEPPVLVPQMTFSAPRLYLAGGVTTMRTTGSVEPVRRPQPQARRSTPASCPVRTSTSPGRTSRAPTTAIRPDARARDPDDARQTGRATGPIAA